MIEKGKAIGFPFSYERLFMEQITPKYYHLFRCIAADCPDSCCKEWAVDVDEESAARYRSLPGDLGDRLRSVLQDTPDGTVMTIENGRCPMWRQDGLCRIQAELGHDALCQVCQSFPRLRHDYGDFVELGLELSCPEAARLILTTEDSLSTETLPGGEPGDYDQEVMDTLRRSREEFLAYLRSTDNIPNALAVLLLYTCEVQSELDGGEQASLDPQYALQQGAKFAKGGDMEGIFRFFSSLEILTPQWRSILAAGPTSPNWDPRLKNFLVYLIRRYWLQAVSDYDLVGRAKLCIIACLLLSAIPGDILETAQLFSKEIENDPDNVEAILDGAYQDPALTDLGLLGLLFK